MNLSTSWSKPAEIVLTLLKSSSERNNVGQEFSSQ
ncbi:hypothetical protein RRG08_010607, partial [Elysia crispata]